MIKIYTLNRYDFKTNYIDKVDDDSFIINFYNYSEYVDINDFNNISDNILNYMVNDYINDVQGIDVFDKRHIELLKEKLPTIKSKSKIYCVCVEGKSRSVAMGKFLSEYLNGELITYNNTNYNKIIYNKLYNEFNEF